jgi:ribulose-5-phosphate 4-epimerase/fuculose-1-phosphate aldolase
MSRKGLVDDLVAANHILYKEGVVDGFGHVSVRDEKDPDRFLLAKSIAPATVRAADIMEFGLDGEPVNARGRKPYLERYIHSEIYRSRPDVVAIVHSHSPALIPFGITGTSLKPVFHMSGFLGSSTPIFEIREAGGPATDMLISSRPLGAALAKSLGSAPVALMRGHGAVAVGTSLKVTVYRAIYAEVNARLQAEAMRLGPNITYLNDQEAAHAARTNETVVDRPWGLWRSRVDAGD